MPRGGHNKKPALQVVREGNPGKRPIGDAVVLPPSALVEPDWSDLLGEGTRESERAAQLWRRLAPVLVRSVGLVGEQQEALSDYCILTARIEQGERALTADGVVRITDRGTAKNAWTTVLNNLRTQRTTLRVELGLSPQAASKLTRPESSDEDDPFDN
jgi:P27 family predicted phage terminase small subunit